MGLESELGVKADWGKVRICDGWAVKLFFQASWNQAEAWYREGLVSERDWRAFCLMWDWGWFRHTSKQDRAWHRLGRGGMERRYARIKRFRIRWLKARFGYFTTDLEEGENHGS